ncbi:hypothetical protein [Oceanisphaera sp. IT1-181]|uniref:hypothetical protein n=1 Tax=Oceanisphaera sp. IT1-181 TaxID=3081199 RepID=UPI0029CA1301|nr:hypothetical protein [Oceanisphaera sp. IT1-181]
MRKFHIKSDKGYWLQNAFGYTQKENEAGIFTFEDMQRLNLNLDECTLYAAG